jgi:hypothetical protein
MTPSAQKNARLSTGSQPTCDQPQTWPRSFTSYAWLVLPPSVPRSYRGLPALPMNAWKRSFEGGEAMPTMSPQLLIA